MGATTFIGSAASLCLAILCRDRVEAFSPPVVHSFAPPKSNPTLTTFPTGKESALTKHRYTDKDNQYLRDMMVLTSKINKDNGEYSKDESNYNYLAGLQNLASKKSVVATAALIAAAAFANPSGAGAIDAVSVGTGPLTASASTFIEKLSETGFYQAFSLVFVSEIGDKTFFIAGLLAMKTGRFLSFIGSISALVVMTLISVIIGQLFHVVPTGLTQGIPFDDIAAVLAFTFFGLKTLKEASDIKEGDASGIDEEFADAEEAVEGSRTIQEVTPWGKIVSTFGLVFAAEFGDRSFLSTIALSAAQNPVSVAGGAVMAHAIATGIAVAGGSYLAKYISEKAIGYIGGTLFLVFAVTTALGLF